MNLICRRLDIFWQRECWRCAAMLHLCLSERDMPCADHSSELLLWLIYTRSVCALLLHLHPHVNSLKINHQPSNSFGTITFNVIFKCSNNDLYRKVRTPLLLNFIPTLSRVIHTMFSSIREESSWAFRKNEIRNFHKLGRKRQHVFLRNINNFPPGFVNTK